MFSCFRQDEDANVRIFIQFSGHSISLSKCQLAEKLLIWKRIHPKLFLKFLYVCLCTCFMTLRKNYLTNSYSSKTVVFLFCFIWNYTFHRFCWKINEKHFEGDVLYLHPYKYSILFLNLRLEKYWVRFFFSSHTNSCRIIKSTSPYMKKIKRFHFSTFVSALEIELNNLDFLLWQFIM